MEWNSIEPQPNKSHLSAWGCIALRQPSQVSSNSCQDGFLFISILTSATIEMEAIEPQRKPSRFLIIAAEPVTIVSYQAEAEAEGETTRTQIPGHEKKTRK